MSYQKDNLFRELDQKYIVPFMLIACCFALWGFSNDMTPIMANTFSKVFLMSTFEGGLVTMANHLGYLVMAIPAAIFTHPEAACVGLSEDQCKEQGLAYQVSKHFFRANGKAVAMGDTEGMVKLLADETGRIVGCHAFGPHSADIVQEVSVLICKNTTVGELRQMVHIHPTLSEVLVS